MNRESMWGNGGKWKKRGGVTGALIRAQTQGPGVAVTQTNAMDSRFGFCIVFVSL